jgi:hypothetical protein
MFGIFLSPRDKFFDGLEKTAYGALVSLEKGNIQKIEKIVLTNTLVNGSLFRLVYKQDYKDINGNLIINKEDFVYTNNQDPSYLLGIFSAYFLFNLLQVVKNDKKFREIISSKMISNIVNKLTHLLKIEVSTINNLLTQLELELKDCNGDISAVYEFIYAQTLLLLFGRERAREMLTAISGNPIVMTMPPLALSEVFLHFIESTKKQLEAQSNTL